MKAFFSSLLILFATATQLHAIITAPTLGQKQYRWRNDDGNQAAATWKAAANTPIIITATDIVRLRLELANTGTGTGPVNQTLEYSSNNGVSWTAMNNPATNAFTYQASTFAANGSNTTSQMGAATPGTFVSGRFVSNPGTAVNLANGNKTEYEWCIKPTANVLSSTTYIFRSSGQDVTPTVFPTLTMACSGTPTAGTINAPGSVVCNTSATLNLSGNTAGPGISYQWQYNLTGTWVDFGGNATTQATPPIVQQVKFRCFVNCISGSRDSTAAIVILPEPLHVDLGEDINVCIDGGSAIVLDAGNHPNNPVFKWDDNSMGQVRAVDQSGTYSVKVTDMNTCTGTDEINVILRKNPVVALGNDTTVCNNVTLSLNSGDDGIEYFWNTGQTGQVIEANSQGTYSVFVTSSEGCVVSDTIVITMQGELPTIQGVQVSNDGDSTFHFTAVSPQNVIGYEWDFGDGSLHSYEAAPQHTYSGSGDYIVVLHLSSTCGFADDTVSAHIVGIRQLNVSNDELTVFPNPSNSQATIWNKGALKMEKIEVYNLLGQVVYRSGADSKEKHVISLDQMASGVYTIEIYTDKGTVARKLQVLK